MRFRSTSIATALIMCVSSVMPVQAFQMPTVNHRQSEQLPLVNVQQQLGRDRNGNIVDMPRILPRDRSGPRDRWSNRDRDRWDSRDRYNNSNRYGWYNGHRGYRDRRPGYRQHNGYWFPLAAFAAGAVIGGATRQAEPSYGNSHTSWCANRWRSYRAYDNTYQPNSGPRRQCVSPYS
nr:BA14K family protein [Agrobacterium sp. AGB01]